MAHYPHSNGKMYQMKSYFASNSAQKDRSAWVNAATICFMHY